jgi:hypothetical protein
MPDAAADATAPLPTLTTCELSSPSFASELAEELEGVRDAAPTGATGASAGGGIPTLRTCMRE